MPFISLKTLTEDIYKDQLKLTWANHSKSSCKYYSVNAIPITFLGAVSSLIIVSGQAHFTEAMKGVELLPRNDIGEIAAAHLTRVSNTAVDLYFFLLTAIQARKGYLNFKLQRAIGLPHRTAKKDIRHKIIATGLLASFTVLPQAMNQSWGNISTPLQIFCQFLRDFYGFYYIKDFILQDFRDDIGCRNLIPNAAVNLLANKMRHIKIVGPFLAENFSIYHYLFPTKAHAPAQHEAKADDLVVTEAVCNTRPFYAVVLHITNQLCQIVSQCSMLQQTADDVTQVWHIDHPLGKYTLAVLCILPKVALSTMITYKATSLYCDALELLTRQNPTKKASAVSERRGDLAEVVGALATPADENFRDDPNPCCQISNVLRGSTLLFVAAGAFMAYHASSIPLQKTYSTFVTLIQTIEFNSYPFMVVGLGGSQLIEKYWLYSEHQRKLLATAEQTQEFITGLEKRQIKLDFKETDANDDLHATIADFC